MSHIFHIPVLGLGYSIDTPLKGAQYGMSSVLSIVDDELIERMRKYHTECIDQKFVAISKHENDSRSKRITAYLNLLDQIIDAQFEFIKRQPFEKGNEICRYFDELLHDDSALKHGYELIGIITIRVMSIQMLQLAYFSVRKRVAEALVQVAVKFGNVTDYATLKISRDDLAALVGTSSETISRMLADFKSEKLIEKSGNAINILSIEKLKNIKH